VCFSKICTHAGCPVSLYNVVSHQLVCPCHQSTFDVLSDCKPVFGPAPRSLPQLALAVDPEGYLVSQKGYDQPVGPGYWNRG
jgi:ubiquinol-cytochrome c reductase iron-sulfur subunit